MKIKIEVKTLYAIIGSHQNFIPHQNYSLGVLVSSYIIKTYEV